jgi:hypothetical protein
MDIVFGAVGYKIFILYKMLTVKCNYIFSVIKTIVAEAEPS